MPDDTFKPMSDQDIVPAVADPLAPHDELQPSDPLKGLSSDGGDPLAPVEPEPVVSTRQALSDNVTKLKSEAGDRARSLVDEGKAKATGALDQLSQMLTDAADQVDGKLGEQYGQYARNAAETVQGFSASIADRNVDDLLDDARELVRKSPGVAIGAAAAVGFVVARLFSAGLEQRDKV
jgi:ElaB/YqjD/DUF883 family membrane-anchored ribosome-binding protein